MLDRMVEKARQQAVCTHEDTPFRRRVLAAFLSHVGPSYRKVEPFGDCFHEAIRQWFHRLHLFKPDCRDQDKVAVDETNIEIDGQVVYIWAAVDCEMLEVLAVSVSPGRAISWIVISREKRGVIGHSSKPGSDCSSAEPGTSGDFSPVHH